MRFLKWISGKSERPLEDRMLELEKQNKVLSDAVTKQNDAIQEMVVCIRQLAETDETMYGDIIAIASAIGKISNTAETPDDYFLGLEKEKDEYLN